MKISVLLSLIILEPIICHSQLSNSEVVKAFVSSDSFCKKVILCKLCDTITLIDTSGYIEQKIIAVNGKTFIVRKDLPNENEGEYVLRNSTDNYCNNLFISRLSRIDEKKIKIEYYHPLSNGIGWMIFKYRHGRLNIVDSRFGQL